MGPPSTFVEQHWASRKEVGSAVVMRGVKCGLGSSSECSNKWVVAKSSFAGVAETEARPGGLRSSPAYSQQLEKRGREDEGQQDAPRLGPEVAA